MAAVVVLWVFTSALRAVEQPDPQPDRAQTRPYLLTGGTQAGVGMYRAGAWGTVRSVVANPTDTAVDVMLVHSFVEKAHVQFATRLTLPPQSQREVLQLVRVPDEFGAGRAELNVMLLDPTVSPEQIFPNGRQSGTLTTSHDDTISALLGDREDDDMLSMVSLARRSAAHRPTNQNIRLSTLPDDLAGYEPLDVLFISQDQPHFDPARLEALRAWIISGGRLLVTLDQVDEQLLTALLRDDMPIETVDRVPLSRVVFDDAKNFAVDFDPPVTLTRVLPGSAQVLCRVNGWPAALQWHVGKGTIIATTLSPRAWQDRRRKATAAFESVANQLLNAKSSPALSMTDFEPLARRQIGYKILGRVPVAFILAVFVLLILIPGIWLARRRRGEYATLLTLAFSLVFTLVFLLIGAASRRQAPTTIAWSTVAHVVPSQQQAQVTGLVTIYAPSDGLGPVRAAGQALAWPVMPDDDTSLIRLVWTDHQQWTWDQLTLPSGAARTFEIHTAAPTPGPLTATAEFGEEGLRVTTLNPAGEPWQYPAMATWQGIAPLTASNGQYTLGENAVPLAARGDDTAAAKPQIEQESASVHRLAGNTQDRPAFIGWASPMQLGVSLPQDFTVSGGTLYTLPLSFTPPAPGARILIPSGVLTVRATASPVGDPLFLVYSSNSHQWAGPFTLSVRTTLRMTVPRITLPLRLESAVVRLLVDIPDRSLELLTFKDNAAITLAKWDSPRGEITATLSAEQLPPVDADGSIYIALQISNAPPGNESPMWRIHGMSLDLVGIHRPAADSPKPTHPQE